MKLYIKEKIFTLGDQFHVFDQNGEPRYTVQGEVFSLGRRLHVYDRHGREVARHSRGGGGAASIVMTLPWPASQSCPL